MLVEENKKTMVMFDQLNLGQAFLYRGSLCLKIEEIEDEDEDLLTNAVNFNGAIYKFKPSELVESKPDAKVVY